MKNSRIQEKGLKQAPYQRIRQLGGGMHGPVYLVREPSSNRLLVEKRLATENPEQRAAFAKEFSVLRSLHDKHIVSVHRFGKDKNGYYFTEEYLSGKTLAALPRSLSSQEILRVAAGTAQALHYLHRKGIVHGDLKPDNVFLTESGDIKLIDFGLSWKLKGAPSPGLSGTAAYMAPELFLGQACDTRCDLYALGVILYQLIAGRPPFQADSLEAMMSQHLFAAPLNPATRRPDIPTEFGLLVLRLLNKEPSDRFAEPNDLIRAINIQCRQSFALGASLPVLDRKKTVELGKKHVDLLYDRAIAYYENRPQRTASEKTLLAGLFFEKGYWERAQEEIQGVPGIPARILSLKLANRRGKFAAAKTLAAELLGHQASLSAEEQAALHNILGTSLYYLGDAPEAQRHFSEALRLYRQTGNISKQSALLNNLGNLLVQKKQWLEARHHYQASLEFTRREGDAVGEGLTLMSLGYGYQLTGRFSKALTCYQKSNAILSCIGYRAELARVGLNLATIYLTLNALLKAEEQLKAVTAIAQEKNHPYLQAYSDMLWGGLRRKQGRYPESLLDFDRAITSLEKIGSPHDLFHAQCGKVETLFLQEKLPEAERLLSSMARGFTEPGPSPREGQLKFLEARLLGYRKSYQAALDKALEAKGLYDTSNDQESRVLVLWYLSQLYAALDQPETGRLFLEKSRSLFQEILKNIPEEYQEGYLKSSPFHEKERKEAPMETLTLTPPSAPRAEREPSGLVEKIFAINRRMSLQHKVDVVLQMILDAMIEFTGAERGFVILMDNGRPTIHLERNIDQKEIEPSENNLSWRLVQRVYHTGEPLLTADAMHDKRFTMYRSIQKWNLRSIVCLPLTLRDDVMGVIYLDNQSHPGTFSLRMIDNLQLFTSQAAIALSNAHLVTNLKSLTARLEESQKELKRSRDEVAQLNKQLTEMLKETTLELDATKDLLSESRKILQEKFKEGDIIGQSDRMQQVLTMADRVKDSDVPIYLFGESGTGKERIARTIHFSGARREGPFIPVNCGAIPANLLESELFGYVRGAFTGAERDKPGLFELAHRGTLFLDEIADMPMDMQAKLLRVLEDGEVRRLGSKSVNRVNVRVVSASNKNIQELVKQGRFREDLFFRLHGVEISLPPLRERIEDIPLFLSFYLDQFAKKERQPRKTIDREALSALLNYAWPGNVRELENVLRNAVLLAKNDVLTLEDFTQNERLVGAKIPPSHLLVKTSSLSQMKVDFEKRIIEETLRQSGGNIACAARRLHVARPQLSRLVKKYRLKMSSPAS